MPTSTKLAESLSKRYLLGQRRPRNGHHGYTALRDFMGRELRDVAPKPFGVLLRRKIVQDDEIEEFCALRNISFDLHEGDIGRNGVGKSILLEILSHIAEPTEGRVTLAGRAANPLEVGNDSQPKVEIIGIKSSESSTTSQVDRTRSRAIWPASAKPKMRHTRVAVSGQLGFRGRPSATAADG
jgi:hypothetical protein